MNLCRKTLKSLKTSANPKLKEFSAPVTASHGKARQTLAAGTARDAPGRPGTLWNTQKPSAGGKTIKIARLPGTPRDAPGRSGTPRDAPGRPGTPQESRFCHKQKMLGDSCENELRKESAHKSVLNFLKFYRNSPKNTETRQIRQKNVKNARLRLETPENHLAGPCGGLFAP